MKITLVSVQNFKRIQDVTITPDADKVLVLIGGRNAAGKSSLMDALTAAFGGKNTLPSDPVRHGAETAEIRVELDSGALIIRRTIKTDGDSTLEVRDADGKLRSPQAILDRLVAARFLDPLAFLNLSPADQRKALLAIVDRDGKVAKLDERRVRIFDRRTEVGRDHKKLSAQLEGMPEVTPAALKPLDVLNDELFGLDEDLGVRRKLEHHRDVAKRTVADQVAKVERLEQEIARLAEQLDHEETNLATKRDELAQTERALEAAPAVDVQKRRTELQLAIQAATNHNHNVVQETATASRRTELVTEVSRLAGGVETLTAEIAKIDSEKAEVLAANKLPVDGLDVDATGISFRGVPLKQASGAEQFRVALALAIAASPNLHDVWIRDASLLDDDSLAVLRAEADRIGIRAWLERVGDRDPGAIVIHDGRVREEPARAVG